MYKLFLIFYLFYCSLVYGSSDDDDITQYSTDNAPQSQNVIHSKNIFTNPPIVTDITSFVRIKVYCEIDSRFCNKVNHAFISAATQLSEVVLLKNRITFQASYYSFCINHCSNSTYGWGVPSSQFTLISLNEADENFIYPQPLAKQLAQVTNSSNWASDYDVAVDINHDIYMNNYVDDNWNGTGIPASGGYWFTNDSESIEDHQIDIEYVILHQMIHGLGMTTSWASYFYDAASPFHLLLKDVIEPEESLKVVTPNPHWRVPHDGGPVYITGFQPNLIFDKFLTLFFPAVNRTDSLAEIGFEMQNFCVQDDDTFIVNFMNSFLNNATQSYKAMSMFVSMSTPQTLKFQFVGTNAQSTYYTNNYLNKTYEYMQLYTGSNTSCQQGDYYQPGIVYTHLDQAYSSTPDFLMTGNYVQGKKLTSLIDEVYSNITITYNVTKLVNVTVYNKTTVNNYTTITNKTIEQGVTIETLYKSAIGPGVLRILETIGYSTVLTNTNYTADIIKSNKPKSTCSDNSNIGTDGSLSNNGNDDDTTTGSSSSAGSSSLSNNNSGASTSMGLIHNMNFYIHLCVMIITFIVL